MLKRGGGGQLPPFHLSSPMFSLITNVNGDNKATFAYHNPPISRPPGLGALGSAALHSLSKKKKVKKKKEQKRRGTNVVHIESRLKFSARVQITLKHVRGVEWLICIKEKKGGGMKG